VCFWEDNRVAASLGTVKRNFCIHRYVALWCIQTVKQWHLNSTV
jgi:hypothetical protein